MARIDSINPNKGRRNPYANIPFINRRGVDQCFTTGAFDLVGMFTKAVAASTDVDAQVVAFAKAMEQRTRFSLDQTARVHDDVAKRMQGATKGAYQKAQVQYGRGLPPYREGGGKMRDAGGKLFKAIASKEFYQATPNGIGFINVSMLDKKARQWHRLNFGASPAGRYTPRKYEVRFGSLVVGAFGFDGESPSAPFGLPEGGSFNALGQFFGPRGKQVAPMTKGIKAWNFLDAGVEVLGKQLGPAYEGLYEAWFNSASIKGKGPLSRVVDPPAPRRGAFRPY